MEPVYELIYRPWVTYPYVVCRQQDSGIKAEFSTPEEALVFLSQFGKVVLATALPQ